MGGRDEKAQPARTVRSTATSLPPMPQPRESRRLRQPPTPLSRSWPSSPPKRQVAASLPRRAANPPCRAPPPRCLQSQPVARLPAPEPARRFSLTLTPEAALLIQKRRQQQQQQFPPGSLPGVPDLSSLLKVSLLNEHHRYDGEEYEEEEAPDRRALQKCSEWLRGVERAARAGAGDRLRALPHLGSL